MATVESCARPYAAAVFKVAKAEQRLDHWSALLQSLSALMEHSSVIREFHNPDFTYDQLELLLMGVVSRFPEIQAKAEMFIQTLKLNRRFMLLSEISKQFELKCHALNNTQLVHVTTAAPASPAWLSRLEASMSKKLNCQVTFDCSVDESILAGAIIKIGDRVMDASVRNKLNRLREFSLR